ncbi:MAG TPA: hypothetical protein VFA11_12445 [Acidimicrobiales bacterium]|nr:hypothetical protein [Acidimicrobiales bacterium]
MDRETRHELAQLLAGLTEALDDVRIAPSDDEELAAWRKVQTYSWRLNQLMPGLTEARLVS